MDSEATAASAQASRGTGRGFLLGGVVACVLVAIWTAVATVGITFPTSDTAPPAPSNSLAYQAGAVARAPLMVAIVLWALCWAIFWRLPTVRSALLGLAVLVGVGFAVAIPVRLSLTASLSDQDRIAVSLVQTTTSQVEDIVSAAREEAQAIGMGANVPQSAWTRELVEARLHHLELALPIARSAMGRLEAAQQDSEAAIASAAIGANTRTQVERQLEWVTGPSPSVVEAFRAELLVLQKSQEQFSYLADNTSGWDIKDGQIAFRSERVFRRFNHLGAELSALAASMNETTQAMQTKRHSTLASSPFNSTPRLFESFPPTSVDQVKLIASWSYLILLRAVMSVVGAAAFALLATPIVKISARNIAWKRILVVAFQSFLPALLGISLTYAIYVDILGKQPGETPALLILAWLILAGWLISRGMKREGVTRKFPGIGTRVVVGLFVLSWIFVGLAYLFGMLGGSI